MGTDTGMGGAITAVAATTTVGTGVVTMVGIAATTMVGAIIAIGGELRLHQHLNRLAIKTGKRSVYTWPVARQLRCRDTGWASRHVLEVRREKVVSNCKRSSILPSDR